MPSQKEITKLLRDARDGREGALDLLLPIVYDELHSLAGRFLRRERPGHTLQTTALVHEAYLRLVDQRQASWHDRAHFFAIAATAIRRVLVDYARRHNAAKRGAGRDRVSLTEAAPTSGGGEVDFMGLDEALRRLGELDLRKCRVVELRFFAGLSVEETAEVLAVSTATVERDWTLARAWLHRELCGGD